MNDYKSDPFTTQTVIDAIAEAAQCVGHTVAKNFHSFARVCGPKDHLESPIEAVFWVWWYALDYLDGHVRAGHHDFILSTQHHVVVTDGTRYRLDFAIVEFKIAVELDGHDFHERTKEQVAYRNARDRHLQAEGWQVFHISGTELLRSPAERVQEVYELCCTRADKKPATGIDTPPDQVF
jgi:very-short-patch-repair endonuclease